MSGEAAVLNAAIISAFRDFCRALTAIFTDRKSVRCSGPLSVYCAVIDSMLLKPI